VSISKMCLEELQLIHFKNYESASLQLSPKVNCFVGPNGAGKTNILDAIYYLSFCKSFFNPLDNQNINHNAEFFTINGSYLKNGSIDNVQCIQQRNARKQFKINKKEYDRLADHIGHFPLVIITPADSVLIQGGSEDRRKYIDSVISQFDRLYLEDLINYNKVLLQRNSLLKSFAENNRFSPDTLAIYDEKLAKLGNAIFVKRRDFLKDFLPVFEKYYAFISMESESVEIEYQSGLFEKTMEVLLEDSINQDRILRYTSTGIHKDDLVFKISSYPVKRFGSQGQQKSFLVAIKLAQFDYIRNLKGFMPILLLDDIFDKLDVDRIQQMMKLVSEHTFGQIMITDTHRERIEFIFKDINTNVRIFEVRNGSITQMADFKYE
jgi:DNA replication and repair protein RecF